MCIRDSHGVVPHPLAASIQLDEPPHVMRLWHVLRGVLEVDGQQHATPCVLLASEPAFERVGPTPLRVRPPAAHPTAPRARRFPRVEVVRHIADDDARYFGPYHSATSARQTLRVLNRHFQLRTCTDHVLETRGKPCLQYQIKRCPAPCALDVPAAGYAEQVDDVFMFLGGRDRELVDRLQQRMAARAEAEDYEVAAALRDSIRAVERSLARQDIVQDEAIDQDVWGLHREADRVDVVVMFVRGGKLVDRRGNA